MNKTNNTAAPSMDEGELGEFKRTVEDFDEDGETSTDYDMLMDWARRGLLECSHFTITKAGYDLIAASDKEGT